MNELIQEFLFEPMTRQALQRAMIGGCMVAIVCGVVGCFVILRGMAFLGDALAHSMLAGVIAGYLFMQIVFGREAHTAAMIIGSIFAGLITVAMVEFVSKVSRIKEDAAIGIMYTGIFALGAILASLFGDRIHMDLMHFVTGMVLGVSDADLWMMAIVTSVVLAVVILFFRHFKITAFDPVMAASIGVPVVLMDYVLTTCTSLVVISAVRLVGVILVVGMLVTPAATAYLLCDRLARMMWLSAMLGVTSVIGGIYMAIWIDGATGPSIVLVSTFQFMLVLVFAPRYGMLADWLRKRRSVPQQLVEDVLGMFRHAPTDPIHVQKIVGELPSHENVRRALKRLDGKDLIEIEGDQVTLTSSGQREAKRLLRAHRLWETYLNHVGLPSNELHERAHQLEHVHDEETVDYLDDVLGHPLTDPHGSEIPEDFEHLVPGEKIKASLLRKGHRATVVGLGKLASDTQLEIGMTIVAGERSDDGRIWNLKLPGDRTVAVDHETADAIEVMLDA